jgi:hypothetical protein
VTDSVAAQDDSTAASQPGTAGGWFCLGLLLALSAPQFICMPVTNDVSYYDIQARTALAGGVLYRDMVEPNLPGVVWIHMLVRSVAGWSTEVLRSFDLIVFLTIAGLFGIWNTILTDSRKSGLWTAIVLTLIYLSVSEWCHVQRDVWLLLPTITALQLRRRQTERFQREESTFKTIVGWGVVEGLCLGAGVWIKPHVLIPAGCVWIVSVIRMPRRLIIADLCGLVGGGLAAGAIGVGWLAATGAWPSFVDMLLHWNPEYVSSGDHFWQGFVIRALLFRLSPFWFVHLVAILVAVATLMRRRSKGQTVRSQKLLPVLYLGWCGQVMLLQHPFDYVHLPPILIGTAWLCLWLAENWQQRPGLRLLAYAAVCAAVMFSPIKDVERLKLWSRCLSEGSTADLRNRLAQIAYPDWQDLARVGQFLKQQEAKDNEVTCWSNDLVHLYRDLEIEPSTRFVYANTHLTHFQSRRQMILDALNSSQHKYVLTNAMAGGLLASQAKEIGPEGSQGLPPGFPQSMRQEFPWHLPIAFRSGSLIVHRVPDDYEISVDLTQPGA